ncbi:MAG: NosD domain-containing protein [Planctomycetota bacterium]
MHSQQRFELRRRRVDVRADRVTVQDNLIEFNNNGITVYSSANVFAGNQIRRNHNDGLLFAGHCTDCLVLRNDIRLNDHIGVHRGLPASGPVGEFSRNIIMENQMIENGYRGLCKLGAGADNIMIHNYFARNKERNAFDDVPWDHWDDGYPSGGNFFADYTGEDRFHGPFQDIAGGDGLGDQPYVLSSVCADHFPLLLPFGEELTADKESVSAGAGGDIRFDLNAGRFNGERGFLVLGSVSGTTKGIPLPGGDQVLPVDWDSFTILMLEMRYSAIFTNFDGSLDGEGRATARLRLGPLPPECAGYTLYFAFACHDPWSFASNPCTVAIVE